MHVLNRRKIRPKLGIAEPSQLGAGALPIYTARSLMVQTADEVRQIPRRRVPSPSKIHFRPFILRGTTSGRPRVGVELAR